MTVRSITPAGQPGRVRIRRLIGTRLRRALIPWLVVSVCAGLQAARPYLPNVADPLRDPAQWQTIDEVSSKGPICLLQAADGAMWFGLESGAARYDGAHWARYAARDGLEGGAVNAMAQSRDGRIFAGTERGLYRFDSGRWRKEFPQSAEPAFPVYCLTFASDGALWAGSTAAALRLQGGAATVYAEKNYAAPSDCGTLVTVPPGVEMGTTAEKRVQRVYEDRSGHIWFASVGRQIVRFDPTKRSPAAPDAWRVYTERDGYTQGLGMFSPMYQTSDGVIWIGGNSPDIGINRYHPDSDTWDTVDLGAMLGTDNIACSFLETSDGSFWIGGLGKIFRCRQGRWELLRGLDLPLSPSALTLLESRDHQLWVLGDRDAVQRIDFLSERQAVYQGLNFECETPDGRQWFVTSDGAVVSFDGAKWVRHDAADGLMAFPVVLLCGRDGRLWAAGADASHIAAIDYLDGDRWGSVPLAAWDLAFCQLIDFRAAAVGPDGSLWFGSYVNALGPGWNKGIGPFRGGTLQYDPQRGAPNARAAWKLHYDSPATGNVMSYGYAADRAGNLYSGYWGGGSRYDGKTWRRWDVIGANSFVNSGTTNAIDALASSRDGDIWIGSRGRGVFRYDGKALHQYTTRDGVAADSITALFCDAHDKLWVGSAKGISLFDGTEWFTDVFPGERVYIAREGGGIRQSADGAIWINQCSREWVRRALPNGRLGEAAVAGFRTRRFRRGVAAPTVEITTALERVAPPGYTVISWRGTDPWWRTAEKDLVYSFRLDDGSWSKFAPGTGHVFERLPTGRHRFEVRARNRDLNVGAPAVVAFEVVPPVWRQAWFVSLMGLLSATILALAYRVRQRGRRLRATNEMLSRQAGELQTRQLSLEKEIEERKRIEAEVEKTHQALMLASRQAGMAEVATNVLHNVGNVLNSVNVSASVAVERVQQIKPASIQRFADLLQAHADDPNFLSRDPKGRRAPEFLKSWAQNSADLQKACMIELEALRDNVNHINEIVSMQQSYSRLTGAAEEIKAGALCEDALRMTSSALQRHGVQLTRDYGEDPVLRVEKHNVLQILVNLIQNAKNACVESGKPSREVRIRICRTPADTVQFWVTDNGTGIAPEDLTRIFNHGFTTRRDGHGFGLHSGANTARALGGSLTVQSEGLGAGATFILEIPRIR